MSFHHSHHPSGRMRATSALCCFTIAYSRCLGSWVRRASELRQKQTAVSSWQHDTWHFTSQAAFLLLCSRRPVLLLLPRLILTTQPHLKPIRLVSLPSTQEQVPTTYHLPQTKCLTFSLIVHVFVDSGVNFTGWRVSHGTELETRTELHH